MSSRRRKRVKDTQQSIDGAVKVIEEWYGGCRPGSLRRGPGLHARNLSVVNTLKLRR